MNKRKWYFLTMSTSFWKWSPLWLTEVKDFLFFSRRTISINHIKNITFLIMNLLIYYGFFSIYIFLALEFCSAYNTAEYSHWIIFRHKNNEIQLQSTEVQLQWNLNDNAPPQMVDLEKSVFVKINYSGGSLNFVSINL